MSGALNTVNQKEETEIINPYIPMSPPDFSTRKQHLLGAALFAVSLLPAGSVTARDQEPDWYQVELLIFTQQGRDNQNAEDWRDRFDLLYPEDLRVLKPYREIIPDPVAEPDETEILSAPAEIDYSPILYKYVTLDTGAADTLSADRLDPDAFLAKIADAEGDLMVDTEQAIPMRLDRDPYILLPPDHLQLNREARRIEQAIDLRLVSHLAWRQPAHPDREAAPVLLQAGTQHGTAYELEGMVTVSENRYLHVDAQLYYSRFGESGAPGKLDWSIFSALPLAAAPADRTEGELMLNLPDAKPVYGLFTNGKDQGVSRELTAKLRHKRRIRSNELHYIDHPLFGILIRISPYQPPDPVWEMEEFDPAQFPARKDPLQLPLLGPE